MDEQNEPKLENMTVDQLVQGVTSQVWQNGRASAFIEYVNEMKRRLQSEARWIPVSERLPEENDPVLTIYSTRDGIGSIQKRCYVGSEMWYDFEDMCNVHQRNVTHWMPLPTPPTEG